MPPSQHPVPPSLPRVLIVDADRRVQQSLADLLALTGEVEVVGRAGNVRAALQEVELRQPDVVLVDPRLPDVDAGIAMIRGLGRAWPATRIVLTGWSDVDGHLSPGRDGTTYVSKGGSPEEFVSAIVACCTT